MHKNGRNMSLHRLAKQIALCNGGVNVWYWPKEPAIQDIIHRQVKAARHGGEDEYEPLELELADLKGGEETKDSLGKINALAIEIRAIKERYGNDWLSTFVILDSCIVDVQLLDDDNIDALSVDFYWQERDGANPIGNFGLFCQVFDTDLIMELWKGYQATRIKLPPAPIETQEDAPPKDNPLEQDGSQVKKGKRGKKPITETS